MTHLALVVVLTWPHNAERELKGWPGGLLGVLCVFSSQSAAKRGCGRREGFLGQLADGRKCILSSSFQSIRNRVFKPSSETLEFSCPSNFLLSVGPTAWAVPCTVSGHCCAVDSSACLPSIMLKALVWGSGLSASKTGRPWPLPPFPPWPRLASPEGLCLLSGEARDCLFTAPYSEGCCSGLLCQDSIPTKHPLGGSASGREVSQEIIHHKRTWTQAECEHLFPM